MSGTWILVAALAGGGKVAEAAPYRVGAALNAAVDRQLRAADGRELHRGWYLPVAKPSKDDKPRGTLQFTLDTGNGSR